MNYKYITETFFLMDNKHSKLFVMKQSKRCKFMPKCTKIRLAAGLRPDSLGELMRMGLLLRRVREGQGGEEPTYKGRERRGESLYF